MIGAIAGDMIGSPYESHPIKTTDFPLRVARFTDDTVLTVAVAHAILSDGDYAGAMRRFGRRHPDAGYGGTFYRWLWSTNPQPYHSWGNGSAMRVSPVGFAFDSVEAVLAQAERSAAVTHDHPEGIKGAQATALAILLARQGLGKEEIRSETAARFAYDFDRSVEEIRPDYRFDVSCQGSVPESMIAFFDSDDYASAVRNAVSLGGDADTMACIAGGIAQAFYLTMPPAIVAAARDGLTDDLLAVMDRFEAAYRLNDGIGNPQ